MVVMDRKVRLNGVNLGQREQSFVRVGVIDPQGRLVPGIKVEVFGRDAVKLGEGVTNNSGTATVATRLTSGSDVVATFSLPEGVTSRSIKTVKGAQAPPLFIQSNVSAEPFLTAAEGLGYLLSGVIIAAGFFAKEEFGVALGGVGFSGLGVSIFSQLTRHAR